MYYDKATGTLFSVHGDALISQSRAIPIAYICDSAVPVFKKEVDGTSEFSAKNAAEIHGNAMNWLHKTHGTTEEGFRSKLISAIPTPKTGVEKYKVLVVGCGEGLDLVPLARAYPGAEFYIQDIAFQILTSAVKRYRGIYPNDPTSFFCGDVCDLPFEDCVFDIVYHFGGVNLFRSPQDGISEMNRVLKPGGSLLLGDEGMAPFLYNSDVSKALISNNPLYAKGAPLHLLPPYISNFKLEYLFNNCFYLITYNKELDHGINLDIEHLGKRGGSIRTRHYGVLEGIDPTLRNRLYHECEVSGKSRVSVLEEIIKNYLIEGGEGANK